MPKKSHGGQVKAVRWTIEFASSEFGRPRDKVSLALKAAEERPGKDGKFSTRQITNALFENVALEREAKASRHRQQIDEAEMTKLQRETEEGNLLIRAHVRDGLADFLTQLAQMIRQSKMADRDKKATLDLIRGAKV